MSTDLSLLLTRSPEPFGPVRLEVVSTEYSKNDVKARVDYEADPRIYDSGKMLTVAFRRNEKEPDAIENLILDCEDDQENAILDALDSVFPSIIDFYNTVTCITLETIQGELTVTVTEDLDEIIPYLPIPPHLSHVSTVPITKLEKIRSVEMDVDRVKWEGQTYAFKDARTTGLTLNLY